MTREHHASDAAADTAVYAALREFFETHRNERWMPTRILESRCPDMRRRQLRESLARLTASGRIEPAEERTGNPYTRSHRLIALRPTSVDPTSSDPDGSR